MASSGLVAGSFMPYISGEVAGADLLAYPIRLASLRNYANTPILPRLVDTAPFLY